MSIMAGQASDNRDEWEVKLISAIEGLNVSATAESYNWENQESGGYF